MLDTSSHEIQFSLRNAEINEYTCVSDFEGSLLMNWKSITLQRGVVSGCLCNIFSEQNSNDAAPDVNSGKWEVVDLQSLIEGNRLIG